jgi:alanyl-tRNA synthetase
MTSGKSTHHLKGIYGICVKLIKEMLEDHNINVQGEPVFSAMVASWFCEKSS